MAENSTTVTLPFCSVLCLIFITLKLTGYITWSWLWVLSPIWIPFAIVIPFVLVITLIAGLCAIVAALLGGIYEH